MKLIKYANKNFLRISRVEWERIGIEKGWLIRKALSYPYPLPLEDFIKRLRWCGWEVRVNNPSLKGEACDQIL